jgi:AcrR family transcriptional regulator
MSPAEPLSRIDARRNRARLIEATRSVLRERGFEAEISEIAERAGIGTGTVYRHFVSKDALISEIREELVTKLTTALRAIADDENAISAVGRAMRVGFEITDEYGYFGYALLNRTAPAQYLNAERWQTLTDFLTMLINRGIEQGYFRRDLDVEYAVSVWLALAAPHALSVGPVGQRSTEERAAATCEFFLAGLGYRPSPAIS